MARILPALVSKLTQEHDAWVVGSAAEPGIDLSRVRDFDCIVPLANWRAAALLIPTDARPNTFGGWKCQSEGREVDVWPGDLTWLLAHADQADKAWHPLTGTRIVRTNR